MMKEYTFSFIIPTKKCTKYLLTENLPAFAGQNYSHFEVLILTDDTKSFGDIQKKYPWLTILFSKGRPGVKRDYGAKKANGDILCFIDDDAYIPKRWMEKAAKIIRQHPDEVAFAGPGDLPPDSTYWEQVFHEVMLSYLGSGGYSYRFRKEPMRSVDDYPSMNVLFQKKTFLELGGFKNEYWPGEDSKLAEDLLQQKGKQILYHPDLMIYHHRRNSLISHIIQHKQYGAMRGRFFGQGDRNSRKLTYLIPSGFVIYLVVFLILGLLSNEISDTLITGFSIPFWIYLFLLITQVLIRTVSTSNPHVQLGVFFVIPLTHIIYGYFFIKGLAETFVKKSLIKTVSTS